MQIIFFCRPVTFSGVDPFFAFAHRVSKSNLFCPQICKVFLKYLQEL